MSSETLLPCPFCGGEVARNTTRYSENCDTVKANGGQTLFHGVNCIVCGASTSTVVGYRTPAEADGAWNRRTAHQERDADARRLAALHRLVAWWDDTSWGSPRWIAELAAIVENCRAAIDAAMAADTQTEGESDGPV